MIFDNLQNRGMLYGDGIFETMRVGPKGVWEMQAHIDRLQRAATYFGLTDLFQQTLGAIKTLKSEEICLIRVTLLRDDADSPLPGKEGGVFWNQRALPTISRPKLIALDGLYIPGFKLHEFKTTSYLRSIHCKNQATIQGFSDGVMLSEKGDVGEASTSNIWAVFDNYVVTPNASGLLSGIVRSKILTDNIGGLPIEERPLKIEELFEAQEIGLSSVGVGVVSAASLSYAGRQISLEGQWSKIVTDELFNGS